MCWRANPVGFQVPTPTWRAVVPEHLQSSVVCLSCFTRLADEKLVEWDQEISFYPVSLVRHLRGPSATSVADAGARGR